MTRRFALALVLAVAMAASAVSTYSECGLAISTNDGYYYFSTGNFINDVSFDERPAYMYVWWGDGTSYYEEQNWPGSHTFYPDHNYESEHTDQSGYMEIGVYGGGDVCTSRGSF